MNRLLAGLLLTLAAAGAWAQSPDKAGVYYTLEPDHRFCPAPECGGWWLTRVNTYSTADAAVLDDRTAPVAPNPVHVNRIDYSALGLTPEQIRTFEGNARRNRGFIRGVVRPDSGPGPYQLNVLAATGTWVAANDRPPVGPYLKVRNSGIVCITTPCPYYEVDVLNTGYSTPAHALNLDRAGLTDAQKKRARRELDTGLIMTGVKYASPGQTGTGLGIAATRVFFTFPPLKVD